MFDSVLCCGRVLVEELVLVTDSLVMSPLQSLGWNIGLDSFSLTSLYSAGLNLLSSSLWSSLICMTFLPLKCRFLGPCYHDKFLLARVTSEFYWNGDLGVLYSSLFVCLFDRDFDGIFLHHPGEGDLLRF